MKESYSEALARHADPESYADGGNAVGVATAGARLGPEIESRNVHRFVCRPSRAWGRQHPVDRFGKSDRGHGGIYGPEHGRKLQTREPGDPDRLSEEVADSGLKTPREAPQA
jgi:hypothetical protein